ncbi:2-oxo acid dehydrogenase subunit E2 [Nocardioides pyridinolyticus]
MTVAEPGSAGMATPLTGIRRTAARRMVAAWEAPVFHLDVEVDMTSALTVKERAPGATVTDALLSACARALVEHPALNACYADEVVTTYDTANLGLAVATDAGLMVPVIHGADTLGLAELGEARRDVTVRAREGRLQMADVTGGTFTVSNLGMMGIDRFDAILNVPQVAILAVGTTRERHVWNGGEPGWRPIAQLTLTCDHRAVDGATGAAFLAAVRDHLASA